MKNMTLDVIAKVCGGVYIGEEADREKEVSSIETDSRSVQKDSLFIPLKGARDGHDFINAAVEMGALCVLSERELADFAGPYIKIEDAKAAMHKIAGYYRRILDVKVVGITGSVGKTSTKEMIASVLSGKYCVHKTKGNYNNEIGLPLTIFQMKPEHEVCVLEMGISDFGEMHRLAEMACPDVMVITNIGLSHLENLGSRDGILKAKTESFDHLKEDAVIVLNGDDDKLASVSDKTGRPVVFYGIGNDANALTEKKVYADDLVSKDISQTQAVIHIGTKQIPVQIPAAGEHNVYNALAAACVGNLFGLSEEQIKQGIASVEKLDGRNRLLEKDGITIIDDCYNANPVSMKASIDVLGKAAGRKIAVLGDMGELGPDTKRLHEMVGRHFAEKKIDALFCTGELAAGIVSAAKAAGSTAEIIYTDGRQELIEKLINYKKDGDTILVKASHFMQFSDIVKALTD